MQSELAHRLNPWKTSWVSCPNQKRKIEEHLIQLPMSKSIFGPVVKVDRGKNMLASDRGADSGTQKNGGSIFAAAQPAKKVEVGKVPMFATATVRKRIEVNIGDLSKFSANAQVQRDALSLINQTNVDKLKIEVVMEIGQSQQMRHQEVAQRIMGLSTHISIRDCKADTLMLIDAINECIHPDAQTGLLARIGFAKKIPQSEFDSKVSHITALSKELHEDTQDLQDLLTQSKKLREEIEEIKLELDPIIVHCQFFSEYDKDNFPQGLYIARLTGLLTTFSTLSHNTIQLKAFEESVLQLIDTILQTSLTDIPLWLTNCNDQHQKQRILTKLQSHA